MIQEFRGFAMKGSLIDMAVAIIIGAAVSSMVGTLVDNNLSIGRIKQVSLPNCHTKKPTSIAFHQ